MKEKSLKGRLIYGIRRRSVTTAHNIKSIRTFVTLNRETEKGIATRFTQAIVLLWPKTFPDCTVLYTAVLKL